MFSLQKQYYFTQVLSSTFSYTISTASKQAQIGPFFACFSEKFIFHLLHKIFTSIGYTADTRLGEVFFPLEINPPSDRRMEPAEHPPKSIPS